MFDADNRLVLHNRRMAEILDLNPDLCLQGRTLRELCDLNEDAAGDRYVAYQELINSCQPGEVTVELASGKALKVMHSPIQGGAFVLTIEDVTERVRSEQKIIHMARHDALTGLPNRRQFVDALDLAVSHADVLTRKVAVIGIDLDRFKEINDTYGHAVGDEVLCVLSKRMENGLRKDELVARAGGDEFTAFKVFTEQSELQEFVGRLSLALSERIVLPTGDIVPGGSLGIAVYPNDATDRERLLANADMAMYRAKESMDEHACYYESSMDEAERARRMLGQDIWKAMEEGQFFLHFQVQRAAGSNVLTGYEVLLRWQHPERGLIPPNDFIPVAEQCGAISALGEWVLRKACEEAASWPLQEKIAVNLSPLQLTNVQLVDKLRQILLDTGMAAERLELEVTESAIIGDKTRALHILRQIKAMGVTIAIDDFGTGYSSLETLRSFPFDKIKLDRSFVADLGSDRQAKAFVRAIVALGKSLDVPVLAEGVETAQQAQVLTEEGCDQFQGYFLGRPDRLEIVARVTDKIAVAQG